MRMIVSPIRSGRNLANSSSSSSSTSCSSGSVRGMHFTTSCTSCSSHDLNSTRPEEGREPQLYGRGGNDDGHGRGRHSGRENRRRKKDDRPTRSFLGMSMGSGNRAGGGGGSTRNIGTTSTRNLRLQPSARQGRGGEGSRGGGNFNCGSSRSSRNLKSSYKQGKPLRKSKRQSISMELKKSMNAHARHRDDNLRAMGMPASCRALVASSASSQRQAPDKTKKKSRWSSNTKRKNKKKKKQQSSSEETESSEGGSNSSSFSSGDSENSSDYTSDSDSSDWGVQWLSDTQASPNFFIFCCCC